MIIPSTVEVQGDVIRLRTLNTDPPYTPKSTRGKVTVFSRKSRRRLLEFFARTAQTNKPRVFLTLTYPSNMNDARTGKAHLRAFLERVRRKFPQASAIWRIEYQKRGAVHFHLMFFSLPFWKIESIRSVWGEIIGEENPQIHIETIRSRRGSTFYVSKYVAKVGDDALVSLTNLPYLHEGRHWGYFNKPEIPMQELIIFEVLGDLKAFWDLRRAIDRYYPKRKKSYAGGCMLFSQNAGRWGKYWEKLTTEPYSHACLLEYDNFSK